MIKIKKTALDAIMNTIGKQRPEEGGALFTDDGGTITDFVYDINGSRSGVTYSPNTEFINNEIRRHNNYGSYWCGVVHSHPNGYTSLSMGKFGKKDDYTYSDEEAIYKLCSGLKGTKKLYFPVVQSSYGNGKFSMRMFVAQKCKDGKIKIYEDSWQVIDETEYDKRLIQSALPIQKYSDNTAIIIGLKNSIRCVENLARIGVHKFILIDSYKYETADLGTIATYEDLGSYITDSTVRKIKSINPLATVRIIRRDVNCGVDTALLKEWLIGVNRSRSIAMVCAGKAIDTQAIERLIADIRIPYLNISFDGRFICATLKDYYITAKPAPIYDYTTSLSGRSLDSTINEFATEKMLHFFDNPIAERKDRLAAATGKKTPQVSKFAGLYSDEEISQKTVVVVGCGGSRSYIEDLARSGIRRFVLWDGDAYSESNLQTQMAYRDELNENKAATIAMRIKLIRPDAEVIVAPKMLDGKVSDEEFAATVGDVLAERPHDVLIAGCADAFKAQARCSRLALKYGTPYLQAVIYQGGHIFEIIFFHPTITKVCPRCMLKKRYDACLLSDNKPVAATSDGTSVFVTEMLNAQKGYISLGLLLSRSKTADKRYADFLDDNQWNTKRGRYDRNFLFYTLDPKLVENTGIKSYVALDRIGQRMGSNYMSGVCLYRKRKPRSGCLDCGGKGDLAAVKGTIVDTRDGLYSEEER